MENFPEKLTPEELHELSDDKKALRGAVSDLQESEMPQKVREKQIARHDSTRDILKEKAHGLIESYGGISKVKEVLRGKEEFDILSAYFDGATVRELEEHVEAKEAYDTLVIKQIKKNISTGASSSVAHDILSG